MESRAISAPKSKSTQYADSGQMACSFICRAKDRGLAALGEDEYIPLIHDLLKAGCNVNNKDFFKA